MMFDCFQKESVTHVSRASSGCFEIKPASSIHSQFILETDPVTSTGTVINCLMRQQVECTNGISIDF